MENKSMPISGETGENTTTTDNYSFEDRLQVPYIEKKLGDELLKSTEYLKATPHYAKAIMAIKMLNDEKVLSQDDLNKYVKEVGVLCNLNLSLCYFKLKDWENVIVHSRRVVEYDSKNIKARYRRCIACINLKMFERADEDLFELEGLIPNSTELDDLNKLYLQGKQKIKEEENNMYKKMFKKYNDYKEENDVKEMKERWGQVSSKFPNVFTKIYNITIEWGIVKPFNAFMYMPRMAKMYMMDKPYDYIMGKCRRKAKSS